MKLKIHLLTGIITLLLLTASLFLFTPSAKAETIASGECGADGSDITWTLDDSGTLTISGSGEMENYAYSSLPWREHKGNITKVVLTDGVTNIGNNAFDSCQWITAVELPDSITAIGDSAFSKCISISNLTIPDHVTTIGNSAFSGCNSLRSITIPNGVTTIGDEAFSFCRRVESVTLSESVNFLGEQVFRNCNLLQKITVAEANTVYDSRNSCNAIIRTSDNTLLYGCRGTTIPDDVTSINDWAFFSSGISGINIPDSITSIGENAFYLCDKLKDITIPKNVTTIGTGAFAHCMSLKSISVDETNPVYDSRDNCNAIIRTADNTLINGCMNTKIPDDIVCIGEKAFAGYAPASLFIPASVTKVSDYAFVDNWELKHIYYAGSEDQWKAIEFGISGSDGSSLDSAEIHYNAERPADPVDPVDPADPCADGHTEETIPAVAPTCTKTGLTDGIKCSVCDKILKEQKEVAKTAHKYGAWKVTKAATTSAAGTETRACTVCGDKQTRAIAKLAKKANPIKIKVSSKKYKASALKKGKKTFSIGVSKGQGKVTYKLDAKAKKVKIKVSSKGKVTIPKKCKKGTYTITVKAAGNGNYKSGSKKVKIVVK